jgi:hypothetical protein
MILKDLETVGDKPMKKELDDSVGGTNHNDRVQTSNMGMYRILNLDDIKLCNPFISRNIFFCYILYFVTHYIVHIQKTFFSSYVGKLHDSLPGTIICLYEVLVFIRLSCQNHQSSIDPVFLLSLDTAFESSSSTITVIHVRIKNFIPITGLVNPNDGNSPYGSPLSNGGGQSLLRRA